MTHHICKQIEHGKTFHIDNLGKRVKEDID